MTVKEAIKHFPKAKALILTHPTYYGVTSSDHEGSD